MAIEVIDQFRGEYRFLSNFYPSHIEFRLFSVRRQAATVEHAYQALKAATPEEAEWVLSAETPGHAKSRGRSVRIRPDWDMVRVMVMRQLIGLKFAEGSTLAERLLATGVAELIEGNHWGDTFWGVCDGEGKNHLGCLLMERRARLAGYDKT